MRRRSTHHRHDATAYEILVFYIVTIGIALGLSGILIWWVNR